MSLITFALDTSLVSGLLLPPGWISLIASGVVSPLDPFFTEGYMVDAPVAITKGSAPWTLARNDRTGISFGTGVGAGKCPHTCPTSRIGSSLGFALGAS